MKYLILTLLLISCSSQQEQNTVDKYLSLVKVKELQLDLKISHDPLPKGLKKEYPESYNDMLNRRIYYSDNSILWNNFANKPYESQFSEMSTENWFENWNKFKNQIIKLAKEKHLDHPSLEKIFNQITQEPNNKYGEIPVGAFQAFNNKKPIWILIIKRGWGSKLKNKGKMEWGKLSHIEIQAYDIETLELIQSDGTD